MIKCFVVDDEKPARDEIAYLIKQHADFEVINTFENGTNAIESLKEYNPEVIFLDVNMPILNGIEVASIIKQRDLKFKIVFVTAYNDYAIKAFDLNATDYLLKPVSEERLTKCLERIKETSNTKTNFNDKLDQILTQVSTEEKSHVISMYKEGRLIPIKLNEIIYAKAENKGVVIETTKGRFSTTTQLRELKSKLYTKDFYRCHRSYIINYKFVEDIEPWFNRTFQIKLENVDEKIPVSRNYVQEFKTHMNII